MPRPTAPDRRTMECFERLIAFDTVSRNSNLALIAWARDHLEAAGATIGMDCSADRQKANMLASFGEGPGGTFFPAIPTWFRWTDKPGRAIPSRRPSGTANYSGAAPAT
jgi:hypothetical protein